MLNRFRITQLTAGCVVVLFVFAAVWMTERPATSQIVIAPARADAARDLLLQGVTMQRDFYQALIAANRVALYRDEAYAKEVQAIMAFIKKDHGEMGRQIQRPETKRQFEEVMKLFDQFAASEAKWWQTELERQKAAENQLRFSVQTLGYIDTLTGFITMVTKDNAISQNGETYFRADHVALKDEVSNLAIAVRDIRRANYQYILESSEQHKQKIKKHITDHYDEYITLRIEKMEPLLVSAGGKRYHQELKENLTAWWAALNKEMELVDSLVKIDVETTNIADEAVRKIDELNAALARFAGGWERIYLEQRVWNFEG